MALLTFLIVVLRYGFDLGWIGLQESVMYLHAGVFMLGAAFTLKENGHVRVDIFYRRMSPKQQAYVDIFGALFLLLPVCLLILFKSGEYVMNSWRLLESSQAAGGLPLVFILKTLILCFAITLVLQVIAEVARLVFSLSNGFQDEQDASYSSTKTGA
ncbi:TRAP transporter small permease subunit [Alteromonas sp. a30]|uniref:TRAP transporter small permease subunit n=1 Tax=Alteromonas sp. a30 TaxID=2730917 RepID=UPI00227FC373|nr:TRAP transporter small permease subunit [Alteromonas sp. a30]